MRKSIFKKAWELFRKFQMTFSQALIEGWKFAKREWLKVEFSKTTNDEQTYRQRLVSRFNEVKETLYTLRNANTERIIISALPEGMEYSAWMQ